MFLWFKVGVRGLNIGFLLFLILGFFLFSDLLCKLVLIFLRFIGFCSCFVIYKFWGEDLIFFSLWEFYVCDYILSFLLIFFM